MRLTAKKFITELLAAITHANAEIKETSIHIGFTSAG